MTLPEGIGKGRFPKGRPLKTFPMTGNARSAAPPRKCLSLFPCRGPNDRKRDRRGSAGWGVLVTDGVRRGIAMRNRLIVLLICAFAVSAGFAMATSLKVDTTALSKIRFQAPKNADEQAYLQVKKKESFTLSEAPAAYLLVEIFSMYCPICQAEAPNVNELFSAVEKDESLKTKLKVLGIGVGNTPFEVDVFRKKYDIKFPLLPDDSFAVQKAFSEHVRTPTFLYPEEGRFRSL